LTSTNEVEVVDDTESLVVWISPSDGILLPQDFVHEPINNTKSVNEYTEYNANA
tara:strand:- start:3976 stop:4137 length:162 start_codon:yes stop_codon:yes gene_type:complete